jgi:hypothetical protein
VSLFCSNERLTSVVLNRSQIVKEKVVKELLSIIHKEEH